MASKGRLVQTVARFALSSRLQGRVPVIVQSHAQSTSTQPSDSQQPPSVTLSTEDLIQMEHKFSAHNYHPISVVFAKAKDVEVWDPEGSKYLDFLSAYSAVNQGHGNQKIIDALIEQAQRLTLSSRAFHNDKFPVFAKMLTSMFGYEMMLPMNTGAEGVETSIKLARKWAYEKKGISKDEAVVISCCGCFHGRTMAAISMSCDNEATRGFGPLLGGQAKVDFGDASALEKLLQEKGDKVAAFLFEPIQGEAGVVMPPDGYLKKVRQLCTKYNVLMIADEIQTGIARTGRLLACDWEDVRPDVVILGKALGAGVLPVSAVLADADIMLCIRPGEHGRSDKMGQEFREQLRGIQKDYPNLIKEVRGRGLLNAVVLNQADLGNATAYDVCMGLKNRGILAKPTHGNIIRLSPPLTIKREQVAQASKALREVFEFDLADMKLHAEDRSPPKTPDACDRCGRYKYVMPETEL
uniref:Ornithine aminotransferase n=1 Tax=Physcomitrium patens TaxID=3218 RepID=A0A7I4AW81_PHYPA|nr:ornithine aminotransferase, mitochondrial-like isoform X2 [Physcomitrium patens]|eukprot:XP_024394128.1 ornithine aminotransferase, mitochondrial-like isoform X2 [Physcomitrella patens]